MATDSLRKRYVAKLSANVIGLAIGLVTAAMIPRGLGPKAYGDFNFLTNSFTQIIGFLSMGTSLCFYTKLSQRQNDFGIVSFYLSFTGVIILVLFMLTVCLHLTGSYTIILPGQMPVYLYFAAVWVVFHQFFQVFSYMVDAYGVTVPAEIAKIFQKAFGLVCITVLFLSNQLKLTHFFFYHYSILLFLIVAFILVMERRGYSLRHRWKLSYDQIRGYMKEFYHYSHPLFVFSVVGLVGVFLDRWMLQKFGGSVEQGFYSLSYKIGAICFLFTSAMSPLIIREFSIVFKKNDLKEMARLFRRFIPLLYTIAAFFACFLGVMGNKVAVIMGGEKFQQAAVAVTIMAFFPVHQTYGRLTGAVFFAAGKTQVYRNIGIIFTIIGLPLTYFLVAPAENLGLDAGATGLAIRMVFLQVIGVNVQLYFIAKFLKLRFWRYVGHQVLSAGCMVGIAVISMFFVDRYLGLGSRVFFSFLITGVLYTFIVACLGYFRPVLFGLKKQDIRFIVQAGLSKFRGV